MSGRVGERGRGGRSFFTVGLLAVLVSAPACGSKEELPPSRPRALGGPDWSTKGPAEAPLGPPPEAVAVKPSPTPSEEIPPEGNVGKVLERFRQTERASERARAVDAVLPDMTNKDINDALRAINSGKRLEAEAGMALITGHYTRLKEWSKIEDAYKQLFKAVPELRFDPSHILEHGWTLMKMNEYQKALDRTWEAEKYFHNLAPGQPTSEHRARLLECRAWIYEGLYRDGIARSAEDDEVKLYRDRAVQAWEAYRDLLQPFAESDKAVQERIAMAEDHIAGFRSRE